jgi:hypothetical protein
MPGWASQAPLRRLINETAASSWGDAFERARHGLSRAEALSQAGAYFFARNPLAKAVLEDLSHRDLNYVVHEYLTSNWHAMYFTEVAHELAEVGLSFVGQLPLHHNPVDLALPKPLAKLAQSMGIEGASDRIALESFKSYALNDRLRRDVYVKGATARNPAFTQAYLDSTRFGTMDSASNIHHRVERTLGPRTFSRSLLDPIVETLADQPASALDLSRLPALARFDLPRLREVLTTLLVTHNVSPMHAATPAIEPVEARYRLPSRYNRMILEQEDLGPESEVALAAPRAGTGVFLEWPEVVMLRQLTGIEAGGKREAADGAEMALFQAGRLPKLVQLGVVERGG